MTQWIRVDHSVGAHDDVWKLGDLLHGGSTDIPRHLRADVALACVVRMWCGVAQYRQGKTPRNVAILAEATGESEDIVREACWLTFRAGSEINWESLMQFQRWANAEGLMEHTLSRDQMWDSTFVTASAARSASSSP